MIQILLFNAYQFESLVGEGHTQNQYLIRSGSLLASSFKKGQISTYIYLVCVMLTKATETESTLREHMMLETKHASI